MTEAERDRMIDYQSDEELEGRTGCELCGAKERGLEEGDRCDNCMECCEQASDALQNALTLAFGREATSDDVPCSARVGTDFYLLNDFIRLRIGAVVEKPHEWPLKVIVHDDYAARNAAEKTGMTTGAAMERIKSDIIYGQLALRNIGASKLEVTPGGRLQVECGLADVRRFAVGLAEAVMRFAGRIG